ncbi:hypothetical protein XENOCAPTIV_022657 [Xenoophorus captivus]|uniref:Uncharacterized protein n=1 Tax=Xenoophorus captivus TaxID=1517983 RepID=A0ABV0SIR0_9TELE
MEGENLGQVNWITAVTCNTDTLPEESYMLELIQPLSEESVKAAKNSDPAINRVLTLKRTQLSLKHKQKLKEDETVRQLLKEWSRLQIDGDGILRRVTTSRTSGHPRVFKTVGIMIIE